MRGLPFSGNIDLETMRYLLNLDLIRAEQYPLKPEIAVDSIYYFTELGRFFINKGLNVKLFPKIFADLYVVYYWKGYESTHQKEFLERHRRFEAEHKISWNDCSKMLEEEFRNKGLTLDGGDVLSYHQSYLALSKGDYELLRINVALPWENKVKESIKTKNNNS